MPDITTMHLKCLLEKATPGPWEAEDLSFCECCIDVKAPAGLICTADMDDAPLIAHAPALAEEVIRLRDALGYLMEETRLAAENSEDAVVQKRVVNAIETTIIKVLGKHDD